MQRLLRWLSALAVAALLLAGFAAGFVRDYSGDFHWHLVLGGWTLAHRALPRADTLSYTMAGHRMFISAWLADVLLALAWKAGGYPACYALRGLCLSATLGLLLREMRRRGLSTLAAAACLGCLLGFALFYFYLRPEMFGFLALAALLHALGEHERGGRRGPLVAALAVLLAWHNLHGSGGIGLAAVGLYAAERAARAWPGSRRGDAGSRRELWLALALPLAAFAVACVNPEGPGAPLAVEVLGKSYLAAISEWQPLRLGASPPLLELIGLVVLGTTALAWRRTSPWRAGLFALLAAVSLRYGRFLPYALLCAAPLVAGNLVALRESLAATAGRERAARWRRVQAALVAGAAVWGIVELLWVRHLPRELGLGPDRMVYPEDACRFVLDERIPGRMLNSYTYGSYLLYRLGPEHPVFIDQRAWSLYPDDFFRLYELASRDPAALRAVADRYDVRWAFVAYDRMARTMAADPSTWRLVYFDDLALVYARADRPETAGLARRLGFRYLNPLRLQTLSLLTPPALAEAGRELSRQLAACPRCLRTQVARAALARAAGDRAAYDDAARRAQELLTDLMKERSATTP